MSAPGPEPEHGTRQRYQWRRDPCHCDRCRAANTAYKKEYRLRKKGKNS